ncbi:hypothetical protein [Streptomyces indiaensis]|nr:hypothetical protein [Streptomyces indiaensis]
MKAAGHRGRGRKIRNFIYFWPLYTGQAIPIDDWRSRMWLDTWV